MPLVRQREYKLVDCSCTTKDGAGYYAACLELCKWASASQGSPLLTELSAGINVRRAIIVAAMQANLREWSADFPSFVRRATMNVEWK